MYSAPVSNIVAHNGVSGTATAVLVGSAATAWRDDDDATYVEMRQSTTADFSYGWSQGFIQKDASLPNVAATKAQIRVRCSSTSAVRLRFVVQASETTLGIVDADAPSTSEWVTIPLATVDAETMALYIRDTAGSPNLTIEVRSVAAPLGAYWYVYELWLDFVWPSALHPCRQFPRADGLAASSARRHFPRDESWQAGPRWRGGYY